MPITRWKCAHCGWGATIRDGDRSLRVHAFRGVGVATEVTFCPSPECGQPVVKLEYGVAFEGGHGLAKVWRRLVIDPESGIRPIPAHLPAPLAADFREACLIMDLSPRASATLARRCLQGMIRDFHGIALPRLIDEIDAIKDRIDPGVWDALQVVRKVGNIGAHPEEDINRIVDVDPGEAEQLIGLIELLGKEWYEARHLRLVRLADLKALGAKKDAERAAAKAVALEGGEDPDGDPPAVEELPTEE